MTGTYDWNPMPHKVDVRCPDCKGLAIFEFAEVVRIELKSDVPFFQESDLFEYQVFTDSCGHKWHGAIYFAGLHGGSTHAITELPEGYKPRNWAHSRYMTRSHSADIGSLSCGKCQYSRKRVLKWPDDAYYLMEYKGQTLWAFNRESATDLYNYLAGLDRKIDSFRWRNFLLHIPTVFKTKKAREPVIKKLGKLLSC